MTKCKLQNIKEYFTKRRYQPSGEVENDVDDSYTCFQSSSYSRLIQNAYTTILRKSQVKIRFSQLQRSLARDKTHYDPAVKELA
jgi:hypothetical protein